MNLEQIDTSTTAGKAEVMRCPFCGGSARMNYRSGDERNSYAATAFVFCGVCGARGSASYGDSSRGGYADNSKVEHGAIRRWNLRADLAGEKG